MPQVCDAVPAKSAVVPDGARARKQKLTVGQILRRLEAAEKVVCMDLGSWGLLCHLLLPECYADPDAEPEEACSNRPGSEARLRELERRAALGQRLDHPGDVHDVPENVGLVHRASGNGMPRRFGEFGVPVEPEELTLQGKDRSPLPDLPWQPHEHPRTPRTARVAGGTGGTGWSIRGALPREGALSELGDRSDAPGGGI
jgi:hypothetical protein